MRYYLLGAAVGIAILAACTGSRGPQSAVPALSQPAAQKVAATLTVVLSNAKASTTSRTPQFIPSSAATLTIWYAAAPPGTATPVPGSGTPSGVTSVGTFGLGASNCSTVNSGYQCMLSPALPVGNLNLYFTASTSSGTVVSNGAFQVTVSTSGAVSVTGGGSMVMLPNTQAGTISYSSGTSQTLVPSAVNPALTPSAGATFTPVGITATASDGTTIPSGTAISGVTITSADTSGATCLVYIPYGGSGSACSYASSGTTPSGITLTNTGDTFAVQWNNLPVKRTGFAITATLAGSNATAMMTVTPQVAVAHSAAGTGATNATGGIVYDSTTAAVYTTANSTSNPLLKTTYVSQALGATTSSVGAAILTASPNGAVQSSDGNVWMTEAPSGTSAYVAVYTLNAGISSATNGFSSSSSTATFAQAPAVALNGGSESAAGLVAGGGYVWALYSDESTSGTASDNCIARITPSTGVVLASGSSSGTPATCGTAPVGGTSALGSAAFAGGGAVYNSGTIIVPEVSSSGTGGKFLTISVNTSGGASGSTLISSISESASVGYSGSAVTSLDVLSLGTDGTYYNTPGSATALLQFTSALAFSAAATLNGLSGGIIQDSLDSYLYAPMSTGGAIISIPSIAANLITTTDTGIYPLNAGGSAGTTGACSGSPASLVTNPVILLPDGKIAFVPVGAAGYVCLATL